jgi:hypothetical protein
MVGDVRRPSSVETTRLPKVRTNVEIESTYSQAEKE